MFKSENRANNIEKRWAKHLPQTEWIYIIQYVCILYFVYVERKVKENTFRLSVFMGSWQAEVTTGKKRSRQRWERGKRIRTHIIIIWKRSNRIQHLPLMMTLYCYVLLSTGVWVNVWVYVIKYVCKMNQYRVYNLHTLRLCVGLFHVVFYVLLFALLCTTTTVAAALYRAHTFSSIRFVLFFLFVNQHQHQHKYICRVICVFIVYVQP